MAGRIRELRRNSNLQRRSGWLTTVRCQREGSAVTALTVFSDVACKGGRLCETRVVVPLVKD